MDIFFIVKNKIQIFFLNTEMTETLMMTIITTLTIRAGEL